MLGFVPAAVWWLTGGWMARGVVQNVAAKAGFGPGQVPPKGAPVRVPPRWDAGMDPAVEHAVGRALEVGTVAELRGFADHVTTHPPLYPVAAAVMRYRAQQLEATVARAAAPHRVPVPVQKAAPPAPTPQAQPAPAAAPVVDVLPAPVPAHVNGVPKAAPVEVVVAPAVTAEG
jgi:hypothetical protein